MKLPHSIYTIEKALIELKKYNSTFTCNNDVYRLAADGEIKLSFELAHKDQCFVQMSYINKFAFDRAHIEQNELKVSHSTELNETYLIPNDRSYHGLEFLRTYKHEANDIYPYVDANRIKKMIGSGDDNLHLFPYDMTAEYENELIKVTPCNLKPCPKKGDSDYQKFIKWCLFPPMGDEFINRPPQSIYDAYSNSGYLFKMPNNQSHNYTIKKDQLRITRHQLTEYLCSKIPLELDYYSLGEATKEINENTTKTRTVADLMQLAEQGDLKLSIHKPEWMYVQIDYPNHELFENKCKPLNNEYLLLGSSNDTFDADESSLLYGRHRKPIYPLISRELMHSMELNDNKLRIRTHDMMALVDGKMIKVSKVERADFPEMGAPNYPDFVKWLTSKTAIKYPEGEDLSTHVNTLWFYALDGWKGTGSEISGNDIVITQSELRHYIFRLTDEPDRHTLPPLKEPVQAPTSYQPPVIDNTPQLKEFFKTSNLLNGRFFMLYKTENGWKMLDDSELREDAADKYLNKLSVFCEDNKVNLEEGLIQLRDQIIGDLTNKSFKTLYETTILRLRELALHPVSPKPVQAPEPVEATKISNEPTQEPIWEELNKNKSGIGLFGVEALKQYYKHEPDRVPNNTEELRKWVIINKNKLLSYTISGDTMRGGIKINDDKYTKQQLEQSWKSTINKISDTK